MSAGDRQRVSRNQKTRTGYDPLIDSISYCNICKPGAFAIQIAHRRKAGFEIAFCGGDRLDGSEGLGLGDHWRRAALVFRLEEHVSVTIDEPGQNCVS